jgi:hypothetical protein
MPPAAPNLTIENSWQSPAGGNPARRHFHSLHQSH